MIVLGTGAAVLAGVLLFLFIGSASAILFLGLRARADATASALDNERIDALLRTAPALAMMVLIDGRVEMPRRLADWFGLEIMPRDLSDLIAGLGPDDAQALTSDIVAAQRAGKEFVRVARPTGAERTLMLKGSRTPAGVAATGAVVIWVFDQTDREIEIERLKDEAKRTGAAFEALTGLIEAAPLPMWYRTDDLRLAMVNSAYVDAVEGHTASDVVTRGLELVEGSGRGGPLAGAASARDAAQPCSQTLPATIAGARRMLRVIDVPLTSGGVAGFAMDVEDLEQARTGAKRFADAQRTMLDRLSAGVAQFDADRTLVFCNQPFRRMFAMRVDWLVDRPEFDRVLERMRESNRVPEVRDFPGWKRERRDWFVEADDLQEENWHLPGGTHIRLVAQPLPDGGLLLVFEDRTEQVQLASARDTLLRVRTATFDNLFEALGVFAADGRLQLWNNRFCALWGFDDEFLSAHPRVDVLAEAAAPKLAMPERASLISDLIRSATVERQQRGGRIAFADGRHFEFAGVPLPDGNALFTMLDITDSRRAEQALRDRNRALEEADRVKTAFVANMSYELKTPLTSISGFAEMLNEGYAGKLGKHADSYVSAILDSVERLSLLVDDVLDLTRSDAEGAVIERSDLDLASVVRTAASAVQTTVKRRQVDFVVETHKSTGRLNGDARRLAEVVEHLLRHAIAATPEGGRVLLRSDGDAAKARIIVSDDGPGMDVASAEHAFDRFAQPEIIPTGERALGLGMPLAKQFVEAHGGSITLVSKPGEGTLVTVELPRR